METPVDPFVNASTLVGSSVQEGLARFFGFDQFKGEQEQVVNSLMDGKNVFVIMPTGGGKSLCYQLPALVQEGTAIVVSPLIALMKNQVDAIRSHSDDPDIAHYLNSSLSKAEMVRVKEAVATGRTKLLYVAPESLNKADNADFLRSVRLSFFAIDEAHCISEWGHDFRPEYRRLRDIINGIGEYPIIALTATATPKVQYDIQKNLGILDADVYKASFNRPNLFYEVRPKVEALRQVVQHALENRGRSGIVYCLSRKKVEEIAETLKVNGVRAAAYHAGMDSAQRSRIQDEFLMQDVDVIVATIAFGMGIDKPDVRYVIHYDMPKSLEAYYQETGRAGRDGGEGHCIAFYGLQDMEKLEKFLSGKPIAEREIGLQLSRKWPAMPRPRPPGGNTSSSTSVRTSIRPAVPDGTWTTMPGTRLRPTRAASMSIWCFVWSRRPEAATAARFFGTSCSATRPRRPPRMPARSWPLSMERAWTWPLLKRGTASSVRLPWRVSSRRRPRNSGCCR